MIDYHNKIEFLDSLVDSKTLLAFCQQNRVEVIQQEDGLCHCFINGDGSWSAELDGYSSMVFGIYQYLEFQNNSKK